MNKVHWKKEFKKLDEENKKLTEENQKLKKYKKAYEKIQEVIQRTISETKNTQDIAAMAAIITAKTIKERMEKEIQ